MPTFPAANLMLLVFQRLFPATCLLVAVLLLAPAASAAGGTFAADFIRGTGTNGWTFADSGWDANHGRYLDGGEYDLSPAYPGAVTNLSLTTYGSGFVGAATNPPALVVWAGASADALAAVRTNRFFSGSTTNWSLAFASDLEYRVFKFVFLKTHGTFRIESVRATTAGGPAPDPVPDPPPVLSAVPLSSGGYRQDFESLADLEPSGNAWRNGECPLPFWQAWVGTNPVAAVSQNLGTASTAGLWAFHATNAVGSWALGCLSAEDKDIRFGLAFSNDTGRTLGQFAVAFRAEQWGTHNSRPDVLAFECLVTNASVGIEAAGDWRPVAALSYVAPLTNGCGGTFAAANLMATLPSVVGPDELLLLRWSDSNVTGSDAAFGVDDLSVSWRPYIPPLFYIYIR